MKTLHKWTISLCIIICISIVTLVTIRSMMAHDKWNPITAPFGGDHAIDKVFIESTLPEVSCNIDGRTFTHVDRYYCDGVFIMDYWLDPDNVDQPIVEMSASLHGRGWLSTNFYGYINDEYKGNHNFSRPTKLGWWVAPILPVTNEVHDRPIVLSFEDNLKTVEGTYDWKAKGEIQLTPVYWKRKLGLNIGKAAQGLSLTGTWEKGDTQSYTPKPADDNNGFVEGSWDVKLKDDIANVSSTGAPCPGEASVTSNNWYFSKYDNTLEVTVSKSDLYGAQMSIYYEGISTNRDIITDYAGDNTSVTLKKSFDADDVGYHSVQIIIYYGENGEKTATDWHYIQVEW
ncbi:hypothetical protein F4X90_20600 [Candidatus Poribacteria bacterium]|nr:hypothetical protein [Candidatus Poribacteria bacterium]